MWGRPSSDCSRQCSRIPAATRATISCPVSNAFGYALVAALGNVVGALAVTRRAARELALIEHFVAFGAGFMLAVALVEVLPEAFARSGRRSARRACWARRRSRAWPSQTRSRS